MNKSISLNDQLLERISLDKLVVHTGNVRKAPTSTEDALAPLAASIASVGLINPLIVTPMEDGKYGVIAGGCRLAALKMLAKEQNLPEALAQGIPCKVLEGSLNAEEISLVENLMRQDMTAADQIEAWGKLAADGTSNDVIASRFGVTEALVRQRVALANVIPEVLTLLREEEIGLDVVKAFTLTEDHDVQRQVLADAGNRLSAWQVRRMIVSDRVQANDKRVRLIGLEAYVKAGGKVSHDLFDPDEAMLDDEDLLNKLVAERLEAEREDLLNQGWSWVEHSDAEKFERRWKDSTSVAPTPVSAKPEETARIEEIEQILSDADEDEWGEPVGVDCDALHDEHEKLLEQIEARAFYPDDVKAKGGVFLTITYEGEITHSAGWVPREKETADGAAGEDNAPKPVYGQSLRESLEDTRTQIVRNAFQFASTETLCNDIIAFNLARTLVSSSFHNIGVIGYNVVPDRKEDNPEDPCFGELLGWRATLDESWRSGGSVAEEFELFQALPEASKQAWKHAAVMQSIRAQLSDRADAATDGLESVIDALGIDWASTYRPGTAFFSKLTKSAMLEMMRPALGDDWVETHADKKKTTLVDLLSEIVAGRGVGLTAAQQSAIEAWVPPGFECSKGETGAVPSESPSEQDEEAEETEESTSADQTSEPQSPDNDTAPTALSADGAETPAFLDE